MNGNCTNPRAFRRMWGRLGLGLLALVVLAGTFACKSSTSGGGGGGGGGGGATFDIRFFEEGQVTVITTFTFTDTTVTNKKKFDVEVSDPVTLNVIAGETVALSIFSTDPDPTKAIFTDTNATTTTGVTDANGVVTFEVEFSTGVSACITATVSGDLSGLTVINGGGSPNCPPA